jgi:hypothetical protein
LKIPTNAKADLAIKIHAVANAFNRSPKTIRKWFNERRNIFDPHDAYREESPITTKSSIQFAPPARKEVESNREIQK